MRFSGKPMHGLCDDSIWRSLRLCLDEHFVEEDPRATAFAGVPVGAGTRVLGGDRDPSGPTASQLAPELAREAAFLLPVHIMGDRRAAPLPLVRAHAD